LWGVFVVGLGVFAFTRPGVPPFAVAFVAVWAAWGMFIVYTLATTARRTTTAVVERLDAQLRS
jgi:hypothetical protein